MFDDITELRTFVRIVEAGSLSAASREMGLALSVVSKRLATLERRAEVRLIARSTRSLALRKKDNISSNALSAFWPKLMKPKQR